MAQGESHWPPRRGDPCWFRLNHNNIYPTGVNGTIADIDWEDKEVTVRLQNREAKFVDLSDFRDVAWWTEWPDTPNGGYWHFDWL